MKLWGLIIKEIQHNLPLFMVGLAAVIVGVGVFVGQLTLVNAHDLETERILEENRQQIEEKMQMIQDKYRLPEDQRLDSFYAEKRALQAEQEHRDTLRLQLRKFTFWFVPVVLTFNFSLVVVLAFADVNRRRLEIGLLRAIGFKSKQIFQLFLAKALLMGFSGAFIGSVAGFGIALLLTSSRVGEQAIQLLVNIPLFLVILLYAPVLVLAASWIPASMAADQDPAVALREE
jgi:hypothetical protein